MTERTQVEKSTTKRKTDEVPEPPKTDAKAEKTEKLKADVDSLLDEIDEILNEESVAWKDFTQKGGQ